MPTPMFYDGQLGPEIRTKLNELGDLFQAGLDGLLSLQGWSPVLSVVADGSREVLRIVDWVGGDGDKPTTLGYVGASGIVADAASAVNVKGGAGNPGPANSLEIGTVVEGPTAAATITGSAPSQVLNLTLPKASDGQDGWSPTFAVATDGARNVLQVVDWVGGSGVKPATGEYVGAAGLVTLIADAVDIRGLKGDEGDSGPANSLSIGTVVSGASASATITGTAPAQELNLVLPKGDSGLNGWSPVLAGATDGERRVLEVVDWVGGQGAKPVNLGYIGVTGIVANIADAVNVRGPVGADGDPGPANSLQIGTVTEGPTAAANISGVPPLQTLDLTLPQATDGADGDDGWSPIFAAVADGERRVLQLIDWTGGTGTKPATGAYVGATGLVALVADATDIRGAEGAGGGGSGNVLGPATSVDNEVALFDGVTGKAIKGGGVLNTGAYSEHDRWKLQAFLVAAMSVGSGVPTWTLGSYYPFSQALVGNGDIVISAFSGDIYTMTDGSWVLTGPFNASPNGSRIAFPQTGDLGPFLWTRSAGVTTRTPMQQGSGNIRYSEGTAGVDFASYNVRQKLDQIGRLINLTTTDKASIVAAINELVSSKANTSSLGTAAALNVAVTGNAASGEVVKGGDTRLSDSRTPTGSAGGVLSGTYPNPGFAVDMATQAELDAVSDVANAKLSDAPSDGKTYGRKDAAWVEVVSGGGASITNVAYADRASLRSQSPVNGEIAVIDGLGLFVFATGSDEPDDDESCFATSTGRWLLEAVHWDVVDAWQLPEFEERDAYDEDEPLRFASKVLTGSATCAITSVASDSSTSFTGFVTGAALGDRVIATPPTALGATAAETGRLSYHAWVSAANTVTVMLTNGSAASATTNAAVRTAWPVTVIKS